MVAGLLAERVAGREAREQLPAAQHHEAAVADDAPHVARGAPAQPQQLPHAHPPAPDAPRGGREGGHVGAEEPSQRLTADRSLHPVRGEPHRLQGA
eukprot:8727508-Lingulodinium_polyedra.AAC.1